MIRQFATDKNLSSGFTSDKPMFVPNMIQLVEALNNFKTLLNEKTRSVTPDITLLELGSSGVTDASIVEHVPAVGLATSTITPTNLDVNVTLDPKLRLLILTKDGYNEAFKIDCQFINWPFGPALFTHLEEAPVESIHPIDPLPDPVIVSAAPLITGQQFISIQTVSNGDVINSIPFTIEVMATDTSGTGFVELYINGTLFGSQPVPKGVNGTFLFLTDPETVYLTSSNGVVTYYAVIIGGAGNLSSSSVSVKFSNSFTLHPGPPDATINTSLLNYSTVVNGKVSVLFIPGDIILWELISGSVVFLSSVTRSPLFISTNTGGVIRCTVTRGSVSDSKTKTVQVILM